MMGPTSPQSAMLRLTAVDKPVPEICPLRAIQDRGSAKAPQLQLWWHTRFRRTAGSNSPWRTLWCEISTARSCSSRAKQARGRSR